MNTDLRKKNKNNFEKETVFGKTMQNLKNIDMKLSQQKEEGTIWCQNQITMLQSFSQNI